MAHTTAMCRDAGSAALNDDGKPRAAFGARKLSTADSTRSLTAATEEGPDDQSASSYQRQPQDDTHAEAEQAQLFGRITLHRAYSGNGPSHFATSARCAAPNVMCPAQTSAFRLLSSRSFGFGEVPS